MSAKVIFEYERALAQNPHKKGVKLYKIIWQSVKDGWVWSRTQQEALATMATDLGIKAIPLRVGVTIESPNPEKLEIR